MMPTAADELWAHFNVRCEKSLRDKAESLARIRGWSLAEWIRRAILEKVQRDEDGVSEAEVTEIVREVLDTMKAKRNGGSR